MRDEIIRKYTPEETARLRDKYINDIVLPIVEKKFNRVKEFRTAILFVAQYWHDEARDAVQGAIAYSLMNTPDIEAYMKRLSQSKKSWKEDKIEDEYIEIEVQGECHSFNLEPLFEGRTAANTLLEIYGDRISRILRGDTDNLGGWNPNLDTIPLFAAFCKEGGNQSSDFSQNFSPLMIFKRQSATPAIIDYDYIGEMKRPWLEGVKAQWDRS